MVYQVLIVGLRKGKSLEEIMKEFIESHYRKTDYAPARPTFTIHTLFKQLVLKPTQMDTLYQKNIKHIEAEYMIKLSHLNDRYDIFGAFERSMDEEDFYLRGQYLEYLSEGDDEHDPHKQVKAYEAQLEEFYKSSVELVDYIEKHGGNDLVILYLEQGFESDRGEKYFGELIREKPFNGDFKKKLITAITLLLGTAFREKMIAENNRPSYKIDRYSALNRRRKRKVYFEREFISNACNLIINEYNFFNEEYETIFNNSKQILNEPELSKSLEIITSKIHNFYTNSIINGEIITSTNVSDNSKTNFDINSIIKEITNNVRVEILEPILKYIESNQKILDLVDNMITKK